MSIHVLVDVVSSLHVDKSPILERALASMAGFAFVVGRVNLIGEHIDYEGYSVLPMAIRQDTVVAIGTSQSRDEPPLLHIANIDSSEFQACKFSVDPSQVGFRDSTLSSSHDLQNEYVYSCFEFLKVTPALYPVARFPPGPLPHVS